MSDTVETRMTWRAVAQSLFVVIRDGNVKGQREAFAELMRMAEAADRAVNVLDAIEGKNALSAASIRRILTAK